jgi:WD40 repeat protein
LLYRANPTSQRVVERRFSSNGRPWQHYRLAQQPLPLDLEQPGDLEPQLEVVEPGSQGTPWQFVTRFLDMAPHAAQYTFEPWHHAVRFGDGARGKIPALAAQVRVQYRQTLGAEGNIPLGTEDNSPLCRRFSFWSSSEIEGGQAQGGAAVPEASWHRVTPLEVKTWEILSPGRNPTTLDEARRQVEALLDPGWRAVTADDFVSIVQNNRPEIARVVCLPGYNPATPEPNADRPGHIGIIVIPRTTYELTATAAELQKIQALAASGLYLVTSDAVGIAWLWNLNNRKTTQLGEIPPRELVFSSDSLRLVVASSAGAASLWDTVHGRRLAALERRLEPYQDTAAPAAASDPMMASSVQVPLRHALFSPDGQHLAVAYTDDCAGLWESQDGVLLQDLGPVNPAVLPLFSPVGGWLVTARGDAALLWRAAQNDPPLELPLDAPATFMTFSPDGTRLAIATADAPVHVYRINPQDGRVLETLTLDAGQPVEALVFAHSGTRLVTHGSDGSAALWNLRTGARIAPLSAEAPVDVLAFSADGRWLATAHRDRSVRCWRAASGQTRFILSLPAPLEALVFSPSGQRLVTISAAVHKAHTVQTWDLRGTPGPLTAVRIQEIPGRQPLALHASGRWLAYADERLVHVWDVESSKDIAALYIDFADANVPMYDWEVTTPPGSTTSSALARGAPVQLTQTPYLWIVSAVNKETARRAVQVFHAEHIYEADALLAARRLVTSQHHLEGPTYTRVDIAVTVMRRTLEISAEKLAANIRTALARFFDPLTGGPDGHGWPLGRAVHASEVYEVVEGVNGVDHVEQLALSQDGIRAQARVEISPRSLVQCHVDAQVI